ncbi:hypothetical protein DICSQDRAFT_136514 [Dichomitus squalens LYAD-421 SS1]|uniref:Uncharacterized protein n=1 Tax=Dichomitus squalens (strain LYAD-421) TaxID=732165 RepID=R7SZM0_DICSQ|nr:uncharacterized protein DICSQDRAFT_136514 [Dichomitus squalens LYAD-421 SS1]EJF61634.1 hypothetical protein DICSQDRAFT_136514 [Dichomitus squalens LYAD-421 SS1]
MAGTPHDTLVVVCLLELSLHLAAFLANSTAALCFRYLIDSSPLREAQDELLIARGCCLVQSRISAQPASLRARISSTAGHHLNLQCYGSDTEHSVSGHHGG